MAQFVDKARDALKTVTKARAAFTQPTPRTFDRSFTIKASVADPHIQTMDTDGTKAAPTGLATQAAYPVIDLSAFFLAKTVRTDRTFT